MSSRIKLNRFRINRPRRKTIDGVDINVFVSPYDIPEEVSGDYNKDRDVFVIAFHYAGDDEPRSRPDFDDVLWQFGK